MKQSCHRFGVLGALVSLMIACGGGGGGGDTVVVVPPPSITSFIAGSASINAGQATTLTAIFSNGTGTVSGGPAPVAILSGVPISVTPTTTYTLFVTNTAGASVTSSATVTVTSASRSLNYTDPTSGTYRLIRNTSLSNSSHLVLDLVSSDTQLVSGIGFNISTDTTKATWVKVASADATFVQNGTIFNLGTSPQVQYGKITPSGVSSTILSAALALKGSSGVAINGSGGVLARIALDPVGTGAVGAVTLTITKAQAIVQGIANPSSITVNVGTLALN
jgi:hypothetical protein